MYEPNTSDKPTILHIAEHANCMPLIIYISVQLNRFLKGRRTADAADLTCAKVCDGLYVQVSESLKVKLTQLVKSSEKQTDLHTYACNAMLQCVEINEAKDPNIMSMAWKTICVIIKKNKVAMLNVFPIDKFIIAICSSTEKASTSLVESGKSTGIANSSDAAVLNAKEAKKQSSIIKFFLSQMAVFSEHFAPRLIGELLVRIHTTFLTVFRAITPGAVEESLPPAPEICRALGAKVAVCVRFLCQEPGYITMACDYRGLSPAVVEVQLLTMIFAETSWETAPSSVATAAVQAAFACVSRPGAVLDLPTELLCPAESSGNVDRRSIYSWLVRSCRGILRAAPREAAVGIEQEVFRHVASQHFWASSLALDLLCSISVGGTAESRQSHAELLAQILIGLERRHSTADKDMNHCRDRISAATVAVLSCSDDIDRAAFCKRFSLLAAGGDSASSGHIELLAVLPIYCYVPKQEQEDYCLSLVTTIIKRWQHWMEMPAAVRQFSGLETLLQGLRKVLAFHFKGANGISLQVSRLLTDSLKIKFNELATTSILFETAATVLPILTSEGVTELLSALTGNLNQLSSADLPIANLAAVIIESCSTLTLSTVQQEQLILIVTRTWSSLSTGDRSGWIGVWSALRAVKTFATKTGHPELIQRMLPKDGGERCQAFFASKPDPSASIDVGLSTLCTRAVARSVDLEQLYKVRHRQRKRMAEDTASTSVNLPRKVPRIAPVVGPAGLPCARTPVTQVEIQFAADALAEAVAQVAKILKASPNSRIPFISEAVKRLKKLESIS